MTTATDSQGHIYRPLHENESRLVHLAPATHDEAISCTLQHFDVLHPPSYEALSYVWGDPNITVPITVEDHPLPVTTNLETALRYLRLEDEPRILWIDAIVINQRDLKERATQVALMADIYGKAASVTVWLGPPDTLSTRIMDYFQKVHADESFVSIPQTVKLAWTARSFLGKDTSKENVQGDGTGSNRTAWRAARILGSGLMSKSQRKREILTMGAAFTLGTGLLLQKPWVSR
jgi:hypothetical protein